MKKFIILFFLLASIIYAQIPEIPPLTITDYKLQIADLSIENKRMQDYISVLIKRINELEAENKKLKEVK